MKSNYYLIFLFFSIVSYKNEESKNNTKIVYNSISKLEKRELILYNNWKKEVVIKDLKLNEIIFSKDINTISSSKPILINNKLFTVKNDSTFICIDISSKELLREVKLKGKIMDVQYTEDLEFLINVDNYGISCVSMKNEGKIIYNLLYDYNICNSPDLSPYSITHNDKYFFVADFNCNTISAFGIKNGELIWEKVIGSKATTSKLVCINDTLFLGVNYYYKKGKILVLESSKGNIINEAKSNFESRFPLLIDKTKIYYYTYSRDSIKSAINEFDLINQKNRVIYSFKKGNGIGGKPIQFLENSLYFTDIQNILYEINLKTLKKSKIKESEGVLYGVFKKDNQINYIWDYGNISK